MTLVTEAKMEINSICWRRVKNEKIAMYMPRERVRTLCRSVYQDVCRRFAHRKTDRKDHVETSHFYPYRCEMPFRTFPEILGGTAHLFQQMRVVTPYVLPEAYRYQVKQRQKPLILPPWQLSLTC